MKNIVVDARIINSTTGTYMLNLLENLQTVDTKNRYAILVRPKDADYWKPKSKRFTIVPCPVRLSSVSEQTRLARQIRSLKPDLVHFTMPQQPAVLGLKRVTTVHDLTPLNFQTPRSTRRKRAAYRWLLRRLSRKSNAIITPSEYTKDTLAKYAHINSRKITVTPLAADPIADNPKAIEGLEDKQFIAFVGRPAPHKNLDRLVDAFSLLQDKNPDLHLVLAGKTTAGYRKLANYVESQDIKNVIFTGFIDQGQLRWIYENAAAYVFPSLSEGFGLPGLEAMVQGCPVISSNAACLPEVYGDAAHYFDPYDTEDMAKAIRKVLDNDKFRRDLAKKGKSCARKYSWSKTAEQTLAVYNEVLGIS